MQYSNLKVALCLTIYLVQAQAIFNFFGRFNYSRLKVPGRATTQKWITMPVDQLTPSDTRTWQMRYFEDLTYWKPNGPIFIDINGEWEASGEIFRVTQQLAQETGGAIFSTEHRYYGRSIPLPMNNLDNLRYLSAQQALADLAKFVEWLKSAPQYQNSKVVGIGGSYAGNLAAWARLLYPRLFHATLASSAPVLAKLDFSEALDRISTNMNKYGAQGCAQKVRQYLLKCQELLKTDSGIEEFKQMENVCRQTNMKIPNNQYIFFITKLSNYWQKSQQGPLGDLRALCLLSPSELVATMEDDPSDDLSNHTTTNQQCRDYNFDNILQQTKSDPAWFYQTCTEYGYYAVSTSNTQAFVNIPLSIYIDICSGVFGGKFTEAYLRKVVDDTNKMYGGRRPNVTRVLFTNGEGDPWSMLSVLSDLGQEVPSKIIPDQTHCTDLYNPPQYEIDTIIRWLQLNADDSTVDIDSPELIETF